MQAAVIAFLRSESILVDGMGNEARVLFTFAVRNVWQSMKPRRWKELKSVATRSPVRTAARLFTNGPGSTIFRIGDT
jgi:hypothetical protein